MKNKLLLLMAACMLLLSGCDNERIVNNNDTQFQEWISPDGVHYWYRGASQGYLAPRYDRDGNLVIDK